MDRPVKYILGAFIAVILLAGSFSGGLVVGWFLPGQSPANLLPAPNEADSSVTPDAGINTAPATPEDLQELFKPFWETWKIVNDQYVDQPIDQTQLMRGAIRGMLESLDDPHTAYMDPDEYRQANQTMVGEYDGIGAWVDTTGEYMKIISPMPGSPAEAAGLAAGDVIVKVDGKDMTGIDGSLVLSQVLGPAGTEVVLTIQREGEADLIEYTIERAKIKIPSVEFEMLDGGIAYVRLYTFGEKSAAELKAVLKDMMIQNPKGLVLDLRNNGGGYLNTAIEVVSQFVGKGVVMYEVYGDGTRKTFQAQSGGLATEIPMVVLVNSGTASASEITAGAIQDYGRGTIIGETTFGKGSVQRWIPLTGNQGAARVTIARWITPQERQINGVGLEPDVVVPLTEEDAQNKVDPQLDKAIEILSAVP